VNINLSRALSGFVHTLILDTELSVLDKERWIPQPNAAGL